MGDTVLYDEFTGDLSSAFDKALAAEHRRRNERQRVLENAANFKPERVIRK